ncbi:MAG: glycosyltransferase [Planctomycetota bacterium]
MMWFWIGLSVAIYTVVTAFVIYLLLMALFQLRLLLKYRKLRGPDPEPVARYDEDELPVVTVQLPVYNEGHLAEQCLDAAAGLDYPHDRLQIQYLDDSDDGVTSTIAIDKIHQLRKDNPGLEIQHLVRGDRTGFKAGALRYGTERARGELLAIFDADFKIPADFLRKTVHYFKDDGIGAVQARWSYYNRFDSVFTALQANKLDMHQMTEQTARSRSGAPPIFHGTAGIWHAETLEAAGGWNCMSEVEDVEITIRSTLAGRKMVYLDHLRVASELPDTVNGFLRQQMRWKRGWTRVTLHYTRMILNGKAPLATRFDLLQRVHLSWGPVGALMMTLGVLPYFKAAAYIGLWIPATALYVACLLQSLLFRHLENKTLAEDPAEKADQRPPVELPIWLRYAPFGYLMNLGTAWALTQATFEGFRAGQVWEVTPKSGTTAGSAGHGVGRARGKLPWYVRGTLIVGLMGLGLFAACVVLGHYLAAFFYLMLVVGCAWIGLALVSELKPRLLPRRIRSLRWPDQRDGAVVDVKADPITA